MTTTMTVAELKEAMLEQAEEMEKACWGYLIANDQQIALLAKMAKQPKGKPFALFMKEQGHLLIRCGGTDEEAEACLREIQKTIEDWEA